MRSITFFTCLLFFKLRSIHFEQLGDEQLKRQCAGNLYLLKIFCIVSKNSPSNDLNGFSLSWRGSICGRNWIAASTCVSLKSKRWRFPAWGWPEHCRTEACKSQQQFLYLLPQWCTFCLTFIAETWGFFIFLGPPSHQRQNSWPPHRK